ncbi:hypothetical protein BKA81DRAFT_150125 [Phyllosticta paracitricarpa]|uniref:Uncharacterized protein n=1 Tax=Phyllosticta citricarpa TaxID=55181 RepID=A0ABR1LJW5_9PEZI
MALDATRFRHLWVCIGVGLGFGGEVRLVPFLYEILARYSSLCILPLYIPLYITLRSIFFPPLFFQFFFLSFLGIEVACANGYVDVDTYIALHVSVGGGERAPDSRYEQGMERIPGHACMRGHLSTT